MLHVVFQEHSFSRGDTEKTYQSNNEQLICGSSLPSVAVFHMEAPAGFRVCQVFCMACLSSHSLLPVCVWKECLPHVTVAILNSSQFFVCQVSEMRSDQSTPSHPSGMNLPQAAFLLGRGRNYLPVIFALAETL